MLECSDLKHEITRLQNQGGEDAMFEVETKDDDIVIVQTGNQEQQKPTKEGNFIFHICVDGWGSDCMKQLLMSICTSTILAGCH